CVVAAAGCGKRDAGCVEWAKCTRLSTAFHRPPPPWGGGVRCAWVARPSGGLGWCDGETRAATLDRHLASRHGDAVARDTDRGGTRASGSPALTGGAMDLTGGAMGPRPRVRDGAARRGHRQPGGGGGGSRLPVAQRTHPDDRGTNKPPGAELRALVPAFPIPAAYGNPETLKRASVAGVPAASKRLT